MLLKRIIPCLLLTDEGLVKTKNFRDPKYVGDPINAVKIFSEKEADEIIILDIGATKKNKINYSLLSNIFSECFVPITYGGGINSIEDAKKIINLGAEKICLQSSFIENKKLIIELVEYLGSQSVVVSIDIKKNIFSKYKVWNYKNNSFLNNIDLKKILDDVKKIGVGEIIVTDVDKEGTLTGTNKKLIKKLSKNINIPLIYNGGTNSLEDIKEALNCGAQALAIGSMFVFHGRHNAVLITYPNDKIKEIINERS